MKSVFLLVFMILLASFHSVSHAAETTNQMVVKVKNNNASEKWSEQKTTLLEHLQ